MPMIDLKLDGDAAFGDVPREKMIDASEAPWRIACLEGGMSSGRPSVALLIELPDGRVVVAQTSVRAFVAAGRAMAARFAAHLEGN